MGTWREIPVTADVAIEVEAESVEDLFETSAKGMIALIFGKLPSGGGVKNSFTVSGEDLEDALVNFLSEILYLIEVKRLVPSEIKVKRKTEFEFEGEITAEKFDPQRHVIETEIKAPTYHDLKIRSEGGKLRVKIVFDV